jgi:hypothetical protein
MQVELRPGAQEPVPADTHMALFLAWRVHLRVELSEEEADVHEQLLTLLLDLQIDDLDDLFLQPSPRPAAASEPLRERLPDGSLDLLEGCHGVDVPTSAFLMCLGIDRPTAARHTRDDVVVVA